MFDLYMYVFMYMYKKLCKINILYVEGKDILDSFINNLK